MHFKYSQLGALAGSCYLELLTTVLSKNAYNYDRVYMNNEPIQRKNKLNINKVIIGVFFFKLKSPN